MQLIDKTVIITGASSGIGAAAAIMFANEGAKLVLGARREKELTTIMDQINQSNGNAICLAGDVGDEAWLCCTNIPEVELPLAPDGFIPRPQYLVCQEL